MSSLLCKIGVHEWSWLLKKDGFLALNTPPPGYARCRKCGTRFDDNFIESLRVRDLLKLPERDWNDTSRLYDWVLVAPSGTKHDSGWMCMVLVGVWDEDGETKLEVLGFPDDVSTHFPSVTLGSETVISKVRMDCYYPSGIARRYRAWILG